VIRVFGVVNDFAAVDWIEFEVLVVGGGGGEALAVSGACGGAVFQPIYRMYHEWPSGLQGGILNFFPK